MPASKGGSSSDPPRNLGKRPTESYSPYHDAMSLKQYQRIFSRRSTIMKRSVNAETLRTALLTERFEGRWWMPFISVSKPIQEEVVRVF